MASLQVAVMACVAALRPLLASGDLGAALRRSGTQQQPSPLPFAAPLDGPVVVPLRRVAARPLQDESAVLGSFYVGNVFIGQPAQALEVMFDTSSGNMLVPHRACVTAACRQHRRYSPWQSLTALDVNANGSQVQPWSRLVRGKVRREVAEISFTQADLGDGDMKSVFVRDHVCVGTESAPQPCVDMEMLAATSLEGELFEAMPYDGIIGLGFGDLAANPFSSYLGRLFEGARNTLPQFAFYFDHAGGEVIFGGHDSSRMGAPLSWFSVDHPERGYWQVAIQTVRVGNVTLDSCSGGCHGIVDSGASRLGVQATNLPSVREALSTTVAMNGHCDGPDLVFDLGQFAITIAAKDYTDAASCAPELGPLTLDDAFFAGVYSFGEIVLRRYYIVFDWNALRIGFSPLVAPSLSDGGRFQADGVQPAVVVV